MDFLANWLLLEKAPNVLFDVFRGVTLAGCFGNVAVLKLLACCGSALIAGFGTGFGGVGFGGAGMRGLEGRLAFTGSLGKMALVR